MAEKKESHETQTQLFDKRLMDRRIQKGQVSRSELEQYLKQLPDMQAQADNIADKIWTDNN